MALTKTDICNLALSELANSRNQISDYDTDTTSIGTQCRLHYPRAVEELVRMHTWNCATFRTQLSTSAYTGHGWDYYAAIPTGCLRAMALDTESVSWHYIKFRTDWVVENGNILSNYEDPYVVYLKEPDPADMDPLFVQALYTLLASKLAVAVADDRDRKADLLAELINVIMPEARRVDGFEGNEQEFYPSDWISSTIISPSTVSQSWPPFDSALDLGSYGWS